MPSATHSLECNHTTSTLCKVHVMGVLNMYTLTSNDFTLNHDMQGFPTDTNRIVNCPHQTITLTRQFTFRNSTLFVTLRLFLVLFRSRILKGYIINYITFTLSPQKFFVLTLMPCIGPWYIYIWILMCRLICVCVCVHAKPYFVSEKL
jgi:hypothetical protein